MIIIRLTKLKQSVDSVADKITHNSFNEMKEISKVASYIYQI